MMGVPIRTYEKDHSMFGSSLGRLMFGNSHVGRLEMIDFKAHGWPSVGSRNEP